MKTFAVGEALGAVWGNRPVRAGVIAAAAAFAGLQLLLAVWVHYAFEGRSYGPFLIKETFGVTAAEAGAGVRPVVSRFHMHNGWDGQFYYRTSTDLLGRGPDLRPHVDQITYRYQRIGVPLIAAAVSSVLGHPVTSPFVYLAVQNALVAVGAGVLVFWLARHGVSPWFAACWVGAGGTLYTLFFGLPDAAGDGVFALAFACLWHRRLAGYALAATLLVLIREGYVLFPFAVFLATAVGWVRWDRPRLWALAWAALPGVAVVGWAVYLSQHFDIPLTSKERSPSDLYGWPGAAFWNTLRDAAVWGQPGAVFHRAVAALTFLVIGGLVVRRVRMPEFACTLPYLLLLPCTGPTVWWDQSGFFKLLGTVLVLGLFLLPFERAVLLRFVLVTNLVMGLEWNFCRGLFPAPFFSPDGPPLLNEPLPVLPFNPGMNDPRVNLPPVPGRPGNSPIGDFQYELTCPVLGEELVARYQGAFRWVHRELVPVRVRVTNRGRQAWEPNPRLGYGAVNVAYFLIGKNGDRVKLDGRVPLDRPVAPGETVELTAPVRVGTPGRYRLYVAVVQEGIHWVDPLQPSHGVYREIRVK